MPRKLSVKNPYKTLMNIKHPVLVLVRDNDHYSTFGALYSRVRIINPYFNKFEWNNCFKIVHNYISESCFSDDHNSLQTNINKMKKYDEENNLKIVEIIKL